MTVASWLIGSARISGQPAIDGVIRMVGMWLDALNWLTAAAVFGVVGKFAAAKPDVIRAEGEVQAKTIVATAQAQAITQPVPGTPEADLDKQ